MRVSDHDAGSSSPRCLVAAIGAMGVLFLTLAPQAGAAACGDHVGGVRVACQCGDTVVSDTVLQSDDPVVVERCTSDGLIILVRPGDDGITLDLGGHTLVGRGRGTGVQVVRGGEGGSAILGGGEGGTRAEIVGFATGIRANGKTALREVRSVDIHDNTKDGLTIHSEETTIEDVHAVSNGRHGVSVRGRANVVAGVVASENRRDGVRVRGTASSVSGETSGNRRNGSSVSGRDNRLDSLRSNDNGGAGVLATGQARSGGDLEAGRNGAGNVVSRAGALQ